MTDEGALLAACDSAPGDDTPQFVLADYYDDHGEPAKALERRLLVARRAVCRDPLAYAPRLAYAELVGGDRAEFVRVQCNLAEHVPEPALNQLYTGGVQEYLRVIPQATWANWPGVCLLMDRAVALFDADPARTLAWFGLPQPWARIARLAPFGVDAPNYPYAIARRGFLDEIRAVTIGALLGGACENCEGQGTIESPAYENTREPCPDCGGQFEPRDDETDLGYSPGTGRTPGVAAALFAAHPVKIVVTDREPAVSVRQGVWRWGVEEDAGADPENLPHRIWRRLAGRETFHIVTTTKDYPTRDAALDALSAALVDHCRELAGLGPIYGTAASP